jgi:hypothetical protein
MVAIGKHRKKRIFSLDTDNGTIEGQANLKSYITKFYKSLFGEPEQSSFALASLENWSSLPPPWNRIEQMI